MRTSILKRFVLVPTLALGICGLSGVAPTAAIPSTLENAGFEPGDPIRQQVEIDGRFVTVSLRVVRAIGGAPNPNGNFPVTTAYASIGIQDGALLPEGLKIAGVRFEKLRGVNRFFFVRMTETVPFVDDFELDVKEYQGDMSDRPSVQNLKATVRLEIGDRVIRVPMGRLSVDALLLP